MRYKLGDTVVYKDIEKLHQECNLKIKSINLLKRPIVNGCTVYFDRRSDSPRRVFQKDYPDCKIIFNPYDADVIISNPSVTNIWGYGRSWEDVFLDPKNPNRWTRTLLDKVEITKGKSLDAINKSVERWEMFDCGKPFIDEKMIIAASTYGRLITESERESITKLMSAGDKEMVKLGLTMLLAFDYESNQDAFALAFLQVKNTYMLSNDRVLKALKRKLKEKYVNLHI